MIAVVHARVLGTHKARTPQGKPIMISTPPFDLESTSPQQAIANRARQVHSIVPYLPHWQIIAEYDVKPDTTVTQKKSGQTPRVARAKFDKVFIAEYVAERGMRKHLKITDECLDPMVDSWYLVPVDNNKEQPREIR
jgi:hypothetical protein